MVSFQWKCNWNTSVLRSQLQVGIMVWPKILIWANYLHNLSAVSPSLSLRAILSFVQQAYQQGHSSTGVCWLWFSLRRTGKRPLVNQESNKTFEKNKRSGDCSVSINYHSPVARTNLARHTDTEGKCASILLGTEGAAYPTAEGTDAAVTFTRELRWSWGKK